MNVHLTSSSAFLRSSIGYAGLLLRVSGFKGLCLGGGCCSPLSALSCHSHALARAHTSAHKRTQSHTLICEIEFIHAHARRFSSSSSKVTHVTRREEVKARAASCTMQTTRCKLHDANNTMQQHNASIKHQCANLRPSPVAKVF